MTYCEGVVGLERLAAANLTYDSYAPFVQMGSIQNKLAENQQTSTFNYEFKHFYSSNIVEFNS